MLTVKTFLKPDAYEGIALFTNEDIQQDQVIWEFHDIVDKVYLLEEFDEFPQEYKDFLQKYGMMIDGKVVVNNDNSRFCNHAEDPNLNKVMDGDIPTMVANRFIPKGAELTSNYAVVDKDGELCGAFLKKGNANEK